jgi:hypothetical protein
MSDDRKGPGFRASIDWRLFTFRQGGKRLFELLRLRATFGKYGPETQGPVESGETRKGLASNQHRHRASGPRAPRGWPSIGDRVLSMVNERIAWMGRHGRSVARTAFHVLVVTLLCTKGSAVIDADRLVQRATIAEHAQRHAAGDRVGLRFLPTGLGDPVTLVEEFGSNGVRGAAAPATIPPAFARALRSIGFDLKQPLSTQPLVAFRNAHALGKSERVVSHEREGLLVLTSTVPDADLREGEPREYELVVDAETHAAVRQVLTFPAIGRVEIEQIPHGAQGYAPARKPAVVAGPRRPSRDELDQAELKARLVLGETGIDMRGDVRISRTPEAVRVEGSSVSAGRPPNPNANADAAARLAAIKLVQVYARKADLPPTDALAVPAASRFGLRRWRNRNFQDTATWGTFLPDLTRSLVTVRQRFAVLSELAKRYPEPRDKMSSPARAVFRQLVDLHYRLLRAELNDSRERVSVYSGTVPGVSYAATTPPHLVSRAAAALSRASALEQLVLAQSSLTHDDLTPADRQRVNAAFDALWQTVYGSMPSRQ